MFEMKFRAICKDFGSNRPSALNPLVSAITIYRWSFVERGTVAVRAGLQGPLHHGLDPSAISVTIVRANQLPRAVSRADAVPASLQSVSMPSRPRSATVMPEIGLSQALVEDAAQALDRL